LSPVAMVVYTALLVESVFVAVRVAMEQMKPA
jgi:hypothetical protein